MSVPAPLPTIELPILETKLFAPRSRQRRVPRERLFALLDRAPGWILVSAPAGAGKTTLLGEWLARGGARSAWLSLEQADEDPRRFLAYLSAAAATWERSLRETLLGFLEAPLLPPPDTLLLPFLNGLGRLEGRSVLVLDDYHTIRSPAVHGLVEHWIAHSPPGFRLVISTRADPPFALSRWRAQGRLTELRARDLRFGEAESRTFLTRVMGLELDRTLAASLHRKTEGWIAGLQMAALSLRGRRDTAAFVEAFSGGHRHVLDYLSDEVLRSLAPDMLEFLLGICILERFRSGLCDTVLERNDSRERIAELEAGNLFLVPLDDERGWYRLHHLFRQLLERQLREREGPAERARLRSRACDWLFAEGYAEEALQHAVAAGDRERTLEVLESLLETILPKGDLLTALEHLDRIPLDWVESRPRLAFYRALALFFGIRWDELEQWWPKLRPLLSGEDRKGHEGLALTVEACRATAGARRDAAIEPARRALELLDAREGLARAVAALNLGASLLLRADYSGARSALRAVALHGSEIGGPLAPTATCSYLAARIDLICGR
ncbi:MAG: hypothetical protein MI919_10295, partial [Holophagales bacterium]|nr:hypothetical protein [Holophagales bacterium]